MILPIVVYGHPVLRRVAQVITPDYPNLSQLIENMWETMYKADGVGLAAPQVGLSIRMFVIDTAEMAEDEENDAQVLHFKKTFINAEILERTGEEWVFNEGCLSLPNIREDVYRPETIRIRYQDENLELHEEVYNGIIARVIQHEYDHIEGKLFIDHVSPLRRRLLQGRLKAMSQGKVSTHYRIKTA